MFVLRLVMFICYLTCFLCVSLHLAYVTMSTHSCQSVCASVTRVYCFKTRKPIELIFGRVVPMENPTQKRNPPPSFPEFRPPYDVKLPRHSVNQSFNVCLSTIMRVRRDSDASQTRRETQTGSRASNI